MTAPQHPPRSRPGIRRTRWAPAAVAAALALAVTLSACSGSDGDDGTTTTSTSEVPTTAPPTLPPGAVATGLDDLVVGQCFLEPADDPPAEDRAVWVVGCDQPHTHEVVDVFDYDGDTDDGGYPGSETVQYWSEDACYQRFEPFVGIPWTRSELDIEVWWPSEDSWDRTDRTVVCTVFPADGSRTEGTRRGSRS